MVPHKCELNISDIVTDADVQTYEKRGWWISPPVLSSDDIDTALYGADRYFAGERDHNLPGFQISSENQKESSGLSQCDYISIRINEFAQLVSKPIIGAMAAKLMRSSTVRLFHDQLISKPPKLSGAENGVGWHTDLAYWPTCSSKNMLTAWIPLVKSSAENGALAVIDKSHKWSGNEMLHNFHRNDIVATESDISAGKNHREVIIYDVIPGQICFHHCLTIHGSYSNLSGQNRLALSVHLQDDVNCYRPLVRSDGSKAMHLNDTLCAKDSKGNPDYSDPFICPKLWPLT